MYLKSLNRAIITVTFLSSSFDTLALVTPVNDRSSIWSCGPLYIYGYPTPNCTSGERFFTPIRATDGVIEPLLWENRTIKSVRYYGNTLIALSCNVTLPLYPTQFMFYNSNGQVAGVAYLSVTDTESKCIDFYNESIVSYNGVDMLVPLPESLSDLGSRI